MEGIQEEQARLAEEEAPWASPMRGGSFRSNGRGGSFRSIRAGNARGSFHPAVAPIEDGSPMQAGGLQVEHGGGEDKHLPHGPHQVLHATHHQLDLARHLQEIERKIDEAEAARLKAEAERQEEMEERYDQLEGVLKKLMSDHATTDSKLTALMADREAIGEKLDALLDVKGIARSTQVPTKGNGREAAFFSHRLVRSSQPEDGTSDDAATDAATSRDLCDVLHAGSWQPSQYQNGSRGSLKGEGEWTSNGDGFWTVRARERQKVFESERARPNAHLVLVSDLPEQVLAEGSTPPQNGSPDLNGLKDRLTQYLRKDRSSV